MGQSSWDRRIAAWGLLWSISCGCGPVSDRDSLLFYAASSTINAIEDLRNQYSRRTGQEIELNFASTATLATQIKSGAEADLLLAADERWVQDLSGVRCLVAERIDLLSNRLVVVVPKESRQVPKTPADLLDASYPEITMANPDSMVPAGLYAKEAFANLGLWDKLLPKMVYGENVRGALRYVETRSVAAGIVYRTDALASEGVQVALEISPSLHRQIRYPLLLLSRGLQHPAARDLFDYLGGPEAARLFEKHGFSLLPRAEQG